MKSIIFVAAPYTGKGTHSKKIVKKYNIPHISTGDLLRLAMKENNELSICLKESMANGEFVSDEIVLNLIKERICKEDCKNGYILDGYPRNIKQAEDYEKLLEELGLKFGIVLSLDVPKESLKRRALGRFTCFTCGHAYSDSESAFVPKVSGVCDDCGDHLTKRDDDNEEAFERRYQTYLNETLPLLHYYEEKCHVYHINGDLENPDEVFFQIDKVIHEVNS